MKISYTFSISETGWSWKYQNEIKGIISHKLQRQNYFYDRKKWGFKFLIICRVHWHRVTDVSEELHSYIFSVLTSKLFGGVTYSGFGETNFVQVLVVQILKKKFNWIRSVFWKMKHSDKQQQTSDLSIIAMQYRYRFSYLFSFIGNCHVL